MLNEPYLKMINSLFHKEWFRVQQRVKELGILDLTKLDTARDINVQLLKIFDNIQTNLDNNEALMSEEVKEYSTIFGGTLTAYFKKVIKFRKLRKDIELYPNVSSEEKRTQINQILAAENIMLHEIFKAIANMDLDHVLSDTMRASLSPISYDAKTYGIRKDK